MCIAILNIGKVLAQKELENAWDNNPQGAGLLYSVNNRLSVFKTFDKADLIDTYYSIRQKTKQPIVLHFRIATSGKRNMDNLHPFLVSEQVGFVHNGVFSGMGNKDYSDTWEFCQYVKELKNPMDSRLIETFCANEYSKIVMLNNAGKYKIYGEDQGFWQNENWYSNNSCKRVNNFVWAGSKKVTKGDTFESRYDDFEGFEDFEHFGPNTQASDSAYFALLDFGYDEDFLEGFTDEELIREAKILMFEDDKTKI